MKTHVAQGESESPAAFSVGLIQFQFEGEAQ